MAFALRAQHFASPSHTHVSNRAMQITFASSGGRRGGGAGGQGHASPPPQLAAGEGERRRSWRVEVVLTRRRSWPQGRRKGGDAGATPRRAKSCLDATAAEIPPLESRIESPRGRRMRPRRRRLQTTPVSSPLLMGWPPSPSLATRARRSSTIRRRPLLLLHLAWSRLGPA